MRRSRLGRGQSPTRLHGDPDSRASRPRLAGRGPPSPASRGLGVRESRPGCRRVAVGVQRQPERSTPFDRRRPRPSRVQWPRAGMAVGARAAGRRALRGRLLRRRRAAAPDRPRRRDPLERRARAVDVGRAGPARGRRARPYAAPRPARPRAGDRVHRVARRGAAGVPAARADAGPRRAAVLLGPLHVRAAQLDGGRRDRGRGRRGRAGQPRVRRRPRGRARRPQPRARARRAGAVGA